MIARYNNISLATGIPAVLLQGGSVLVSKDPAQETLEKVLLYSGMILLAFGFYFYTAAKGRHWAWSFLAVFSVLGLIVLAGLDDHCPDGEPTQKEPTGSNSGTT